MAIKRDICGKMTNKYRTMYSGDVVCLGTCVHAFHLESYLLRLEEQRGGDEPLNPKTYQNAKEMSAWLSILKYGNQKNKKIAEKEIKAWAKHT